MTQRDHDPWNDRDDHGQDPVIEVLTPAVAIARTPSPARPQHDTPQLGSNPRLAPPHLLPQQSTSAYTPWQDSFSPPTPCPPASQPPQPLRAQPHNINTQYAAEVIPRSVPTTNPPQFMGTYHDGRPTASSLVPTRGLIPTSLDGGAAPPNPMPPAAWGRGPAVSTWELSLPGLCRRCTMAHQHVDAAGDGVGPGLSSVGLPRLHLRPHLGCTEWIPAPTSCGACPLDATAIPRHRCAHHGHTVLRVVVDDGRHRSSRTSECRAVLPGGP